MGLIYVFNLIVGTGALTLPSVFAKAGWLLSTVLIIFLAFVGFITVTFVIETMAVANATIQIRKLQSHKIDGVCILVHVSKQIVIIKTSFCFFYLKILCKGFIILDGSK